MAPEYGATCGFFPIDGETIEFLVNTGRKPARVALVEKYARAQGLFRTHTAPERGVQRHDRTRSRRGRALPRRPKPEGRIALDSVAAGFTAAWTHGTRRSLCSPSV